MASGLSQRFGSNKLLVQFKGKSLIEAILDKTESLCDAQAAGTMEATEPFINKRLVLTRTKEVQDFCTARDVDVIFHELPNRNDAVKLGMERMMDCDAVIFCTCDQPLLKAESIKKIIQEFSQKGSGIYRLAFSDEVGNPILFSKEYFDELCKLPSKKGGAYLAAAHPENVALVMANDKWELFDVDTPEDLILLNKVERD